jgi:hypothetical protein
MRKLAVTLCLFSAVLPFKATASISDCDAALIQSTYNLSDGRFQDSRLAQHVNQSAYDKIRHDAGGHATIFGVPVGLNYDDFQNQAQQAVRDLNSSMTNSEAQNVMWTGVDPNTNNLYSSCLQAVTAMSGLHLSVQGATETDIAIRVHYAPTGNNPAQIALNWSPPSFAGIQLPSTMIAGDMIVRVPRPERSMQLVVNGSQSGSADAIVLTPLPPKVDAPRRPRRMACVVAPPVPPCEASDDAVQNAPCVCPGLPGLPPIGGGTVQPADSLGTRQVGFPQRVPAGLPAQYNSGGLPNPITLPPGTLPAPSALPPGSLPAPANLPPGALPLPGAPNFVPQ